MTRLSKIEHAQFEIFASSNVYAAGPVCCETQKGDKIEKGAMCTILNTPSWNEYATGAYHWLPFKTPLYIVVDKMQVFVEQYKGMERVFTRELISQGTTQCSD